MTLPYRPNLKQPARQLRKNMTEAEKRLWEWLRLRQIEGYRFSRQKPIGGYIVDFYCPRAKMVIEVDGSQHYAGEVAGNDIVRDEYMTSLGLRVLRFSNTEVLQHIEAVIFAISQELGKIPLSLPIRQAQGKPLLKGETITQTTSSPFRKGRPRRVSASRKIPLSPPLPKGETTTANTTSSPFNKRESERDFQKGKG